MENNNQIIPASFSSVMDIKQPTSSEWSCNKTPNELIEMSKEYEHRPRVMKRLLMGKYPSPWSEFDHCFRPMKKGFRRNASNKIEWRPAHKATEQENRIMSDLYILFDWEGHTGSNGFRMNMRDPQFPNVNVDWSDYHILTVDGIIAGMYRASSGAKKGSNYHDEVFMNYKRIKDFLTMDIVFILPTFRRQGLFRRIYNSIYSEHGIFYVDSPNFICRKALDEFGYKHDVAAKAHNSNIKWSDIKEEM